MTKVTPGFVTWLLFVILLVVTILEIRKNKRFVFIDRILLLVTGVLGIVVFYLWFLTEHSATGSNYNILWAMPTNVILLFYLNNAANKTFFRYLAYVTWAALFVVLAGWKILPQEMPASAFPVALIMLIRLKRYFFR